MWHIVKCLFGRAEQHPFNKARCPLKDAFPVETRLNKSKSDGTQEKGMVCLTFDVLIFRWKEFHQRSES